jgi:hypothetical protein
VCTTDIYTHECTISGINQNGDYVVAQYTYSWTGISACQCLTFWVIGWHENHPARGRRARDR